MKKDVVFGDNIVYIVENIGDYREKRKYAVYFV